MHSLNLTATDVQIPTIDMGPARQTWAKEVLQNPKAHHDRLFGQTGDAGEMLVQAALTL